MFMRAAAILVAVSFAMVGDAWPSELRVQKMLGGRAELTVPVELALMDDETRRTRYPGEGGPSEVLADASGRVSIVAGIQKIPSRTIDEMLSAMVAGIGRGRTFEAWHDKGKRIINGREFGFVEFTARATEASVYNYIYFTFYGDQLIMFTVNSTTEKLPEWKTVLHDVVSSTRILAAQ